LRLFGLLLALFGESEIFSQDLVFGCIASNGPPYYLGSITNLEGGIFYDIAWAVARKLGVKARFVEIPRRRLEEKLHEGAYNIIPIFHPDWSEFPNRLIFSPPLVEERNVLIAPPEYAEKILGLDNLHGKTIGGIRGYIYNPIFQKGVEEGLYAREDVSDHRTNFEKLLLGRIDGFIIPDLIADYKFKTNPPYRQLKIAPYILSDQYIHWAFSIQNRPFADQVSHALQELLDQGEIGRILSRYR